MMDERTQPDGPHILEEKVQMLQRIPLSSLLIQAEDNIQDRQFARWRASNRQQWIF
ncbi:hypothetical protein HN020_24830 [Brevibacillus borstelensis]|uniref:hypothetical protein n=1 Tax=Brevibacillus borstelensis TaxID=45462 RepID=UPI0014900A5E|nr:hypothetical protein [Brevibacillus borstelensis]NOU57924.1 hypothetical protein [Brevibacillus borstelensis]